MNPEELPKPERAFAEGDEVVIPDSYVNRGIPGYTDQKAEGWIIWKILKNPQNDEFYAKLTEKGGLASKTISLKELREVNP